MTHITEIIPDDAPDWIMEAIAKGQLFNTIIEREKKLPKFIYKQIKHGDKAHRKWLKQSLKDIFKGIPVEKQELA